VAITSNDVSFGKYTMAGAITPNGFQAKSFQQCRDDLVNLFHEVWHDINTDSASPSGQLIDILSTQEAYLWQAIQEVYMASSPTTATDMSLDFLADQKGLTRFQHQVASAQILVYYASATNILLAAGFEVASERDGWIFQTTNDYALNEQGIRKMFIQADANFANERIFQLDDGLPIISISEENELESLRDLKVTLEQRGFVCELWSNEHLHQLDFDFGNRPVLEITANPSITLLTSTWVGFRHTVLAKIATVYRDEPTTVAVDAGKLNRIVNQIDGVLKVYNTTLSNKGRLKEADSELRQRMVKLQLNGLATMGALEFNLLDGVLGVTFVKISQKFNTPFDENHASNNYIHILIEGGEEADIVATIARVKAAGVATFKTSENSLGGYYDGTREEIWFDRPANVHIELRVYFTYNLQEATIANYGTVIGQSFVEFLQSTARVSGVLVANKFLQVLYSYPGFGASWCNIRKMGETEWRKEIQIAENERPVLNFNSIVWEQRNP
jgi:uncharacterized phage protein gp47/JayE